MSAESVRQNGEPSPDSDLDGHRDEAERADARDRDRDLDDDKDKDEAEDNERRRTARLPTTPAVNERDEDPGALTPDRSGRGRGRSRRSPRDIRKAVMDDDSLSFTAKNVKIITQDGKVTLARSGQERAGAQRIGAAAKKVAARSRGQSTRSREVRRTDHGQSSDRHRRDDASRPRQIVGEPAEPPASRTTTSPSCSRTRRARKDFAHEHNTKAPEGAVAGAAPAACSAARSACSRASARSPSRASGRSSRPARSWRRSAARRPAPPSAASPAR